VLESENMPAVHLITGATGLLGSHLAEQLRGAGETVRALVRPRSDVRFLRGLGVELVAGELGDRSALDRACAGADVVYHAAARVGDWGPWEDFQRDTVEGTRRVAEACLTAGVRRLIGISTISVYGHPRRRAAEITEEEPLGQRLWWWDHYIRAKVMAEELLWQLHREAGLPVTVIRPGWIYGPRDRTRIFLLASALRWWRMPVLGWGRNRLNLVYVGNVAEACLLAARTPEAVGQAYNVSQDGPITQRAFLDLLARELGTPRPWWYVPYSLGFASALGMECVGRTLGIPSPPPLTRYMAWYLGGQGVYSTAKCQRELGWQPRVSYAEGVRETVRWYRQIRQSLGNIGELPVGLH
jgi:nucleoside-diphosphate-sugar epimerase